MIKHKGLLTAGAITATASAAVAVRHHNAGPHAPHGNPFTDEPDLTPDGELETSDFAAFTTQP